MGKLTQKDEELVEEATEALDNAYAPYSHFPVGAAVRTDDGSVFKGANIENASYGLTNCAERTAIFKAVSEGKSRILDLAIVLDVDEGVGAPCGACRQVINEFNANMNILMATTGGQVEKVSLDELLPYAFGGNYLEQQSDDGPAREYVDRQTKPE